MESIEVELLEEEITAVLDNEDIDSFLLGGEYIDQATIVPYVGATKDINLNSRNLETTGLITASNLIYISTGILAPATTPTKVGNIFVNTVLKKVYVATGTTNSSDWTIIN
jgi:hypothetical protein